MNFMRTFSKFSQILQAICIFLPNPRKINARSLIYFEYAKLMHFRNFLKKTFKSSKMPRHINNQLTYLILKEQIGIFGF